jgi:hypothetical protein
MRHVGSFQDRIQVTCIPAHKRYVMNMPDVEPIIDPVSCSIYCRKFVVIRPYGISIVIGPQGAGQTRVVMLQDAMDSKQIIPRNVCIKRTREKALMFTLQIWSDGLWKVRLAIQTRKASYQEANQVYKHEKFLSDTYLCPSYTCAPDIPNNLALSAGDGVKTQKKIQTLPSP